MRFCSEIRTRLFPARDPYAWMVRYLGYTVSLIYRQLRHITQDVRLMGQVDMRIQATTWP